MTLARFVTAEGTEFWAEDHADVNRGSPQARIDFVRMPEPCAHFVAGSLHHGYMAKLVSFHVWSYRVDVLNNQTGSHHRWHEYRELGADRDANWSAMSIEARRNARSIETAVAVPGVS